MSIAILQCQMVKIVSNFLPSLFFAICHSLTTVSLDTSLTDHSITWYFTHWTQYHLILHSLTTVSLDTSLIDHSITWYFTHWPQYHLILHSLSTVSLDTIVSEAVTASLHKYVLPHAVFRRFRSYQKCTKITNRSFRNKVTTVWCQEFYSDSDKYMALG